LNCVLGILLVALGALFFTAKRFRNKAPGLLQPWDEQRNSGFNRNAVAPHEVHGLELLRAQAVPG